IFGAATEIMLLMALPLTAAPPSAATCMSKSLQSLMVRSSLLRAVKPRQACCVRPIRPTSRGVFGFPFSISKRQRRDLANEIPPLPLEGTSLLLGHDLQLQVHRHLGVQSGLNLVLAQRLDVLLARVDDPLVELRTTGGLDGIDDVGRRDRTEQLLRTLGGLALHPDGAEVLQRGTDLLGVVQVTDAPCLLDPTDGADVLLRALGGRDREATRQQVVTRVTVLDLNDVTGAAEVRHVGRQDDLRHV